MSHFPFFLNPRSKTIHFRPGARHHSNSRPQTHPPLPVAPPPSLFNVCSRETKIFLSFFFLNPIIELSLHLWTFDPGLQKIELLVVFPRWNPIEMTPHCVGCCVIYDRISIFLRDFYHVTRINSLGWEKFPTKCWMISQLFKFFFFYTLEILLLYLRGLEIVIKCYKVRKYSSWDTH